MGADHEKRCKNDHTPVGRSFLDDFGGKLHNFIFSSSDRCMAVFTAFFVISTNENLVAHIFRFFRYKIFDFPLINRHFFRFREQKWTCAMSAYVRERDFRYIMRPPE